MIIKKMKNNIIVKIAIAMAVFIAIIIGLNQINVFAATRTLTLTLNGDEEIHLWIGTEYQELGATAYDTVDGDLTDSIIVDASSIDKDVEGLYTVTYSITNSSSMTETKTRKVYVQDSNFQQHTRFIKRNTTSTIYDTGNNASYSDSSNTINKVIKTRDNCYFAIGNMKGSTEYSNSICVYIAKYDSSFNLLWHKQLPTISSYNYGLDVEEDGKGNFLLSCLHTGNGTNSYIHIVDANGNLLLSKYIDSSTYCNIEKKNDSEYYLFGASHTGYFSFSLEYSGSTPSITNFQQIIVTTPLYAGNPSNYCRSRGIYFNGRVYYMTSDNSPSSYVSYYDLSTGAFVSSSYSVNNGNFCIYDNKVYCFTYDSQLVILDLDLNLIKSKPIGENCQGSAFTVNDNYIVFLSSTYNNTLRYYSRKTLEFVSSSVLDTQLIYSYGLIAENDYTYVFGVILDAYYYVYFSRITSTVNINYENSIFNAYTNNDYSNGVNIDGLFTNYYITKIDKGNVNNQLCGNYELCYYYKIYFGDIPQTWICKRNITLEPKTSIAEGAVYGGSKIIDVEGGTIEVNGISYLKGDTYSEPGTAIMKIYGKDDYVKSINFYIDLNVSGVDNNGEYDESVTPIISGGTCTLNGEPYQSGQMIVGPGYYQLVINGNETQSIINFTINPILNVEDGGEYNYSLIPAISSATMTLDDNVYISNTLINTPGEHVLKINGVNDYYKEISFTIVSGANVEDDAKYELSKEIYFVGDSAKLNGESITNGYNITKIGNYQLVINSGTDICTYNFTVEPKVTGIEENGSYDANASINVEGNFENATINGTISSELKNTGTLDLDVIGNNILSINGVNGFSKKYNFTINPVVTGFVEGKSYTGEVSYSIEGTYSKILLNDVEVETITSVNNVGLNVLKIIGVNDYEKSCMFRIIKDVPNIENDGVYNGSITPVLYDQTLIYKLNGNNYTINTPIKTIGNNLLTISNGDDYYREINFVIEPVFNNQTEEEKYDFIPSFTGDADYYLNGVLVDNINTTIIDIVGYNKIHVVGLNGYTKDYEITIKESYSGIQKDATANSFNIKNNSKCELYIDDVLIGNEINYSIIGNHKFTIKGLNNYSKSFDFTVIANFNIDSQYEEKFEPLEFEECIVRIDGINYVSGANFIKIGNHTLTVYGAGNYTKNYNFTIVPKVYGENSTGIYDELITFELLDDSAVMKIDDISYTSNSDYNKIGNHKLSILGSNNYVYEHEFTIKEKVVSFEENGNYENSVIIGVDNYCNKITLDGTTISNGYNCNTIGTHEIKIYGTNNYVNTYTVSVYPSIVGVEEGKTYTSTVSWTIGGKGTCVLDGNNVAMNSSTNKVGKHILEIKSNFDYSKTIEFYILPDIIGIVDGSEYISSVTFTIDNCELWLNGKKLSTNSSTLSTIGNHTLVIIGTNDYSKQIQFTIKEASLGFTNGATYDSLVLVGLDNTTSYLDGNKVTSNTKVTKPGLHKLQVTGVGGYSKNYQFTINANPSFNSNIINCADCTIMLNGTSVTNQTPISTIGKNEITIIGTNGYEKTYYVDIASNCDISNNTTYENRVLVKKLNARMFIDGDEIFEDTYVEENGSHKLVIVGVGGYEEVIDFKVQNNNITYSIVFTSVVLVFITFFVVLIIRRRRVI